VNTRKEVFRPNRILNSMLIKFDRGGHLNLCENIEIGREYELIPTNAWDCFLKWYGADYEL